MLLRVCSALRARSHTSLGHRPKNFLTADDADNTDGKRGRRLRGRILRSSTVLAPRSQTPVWERTRPGESVRLADLGFETLFRCTRKQPLFFDHFCHLVIRIWSCTSDLLPSSPIIRAIRAIRGSIPEFSARPGGRKERIVNGRRSGLGRRDERIRGVTHKSETLIPVRRAQLGLRRVLLWGAYASPSCSPR